MYPNIYIYIYIYIYIFDKCAINNTAILHEWKESKDADRMMKQSKYECQN